MKERLRNEVKSFAIFGSIGLLYLLFVLFTKQGIPCIFYVLTGWKCPGCGITRMLVSAVQLDFPKAMESHPVLFFTLPVIVGCILYERIRYVKTGEGELCLVTKVFFFLEILLLILYGIIRNIG